MITKKQNTDLLQQVENLSSIISNLSSSNQSLVSYVKHLESRVRHFEAIEEDRLSKVQEFLDDMADSLSYL